MATKAKLALVKLLKEKGSEGRYLDVSDKGQRRMRMIRGGTANREVRTYGERDLEKAEDVKHCCWSMRDGRMNGWTCFRHCPQ